MAEWYQVKDATDIPSPALLLYPDRIAENLRRMIGLAGTPEKLRPHVKTHKIEQIVRMKIALGITKFKTSTIAEAELAAGAGASDVLLAYPLVGPNIDRLLTLMTTFANCKFSSLVDDIDNLHIVSQKACDRNQIIPLYVDLNVGMGRTGITPGEPALQLYRKMATLNGVSPAGLHAYDGHLHENDVDVLRRRVQETFQPVWQMRLQLQSEGISVPNIIAAGTPTSKLLAEHENVEVGAGTTVLWDAGQSKLSPDLDFLNAAVLLARVISKPEPDRICIDLGHKAVASEMVHPRIRIFGLEDAIPVIHSEEHLVLKTDRAGEYKVGQVLYGIPHHVCPTVALYNEALCVREGAIAETWAVAARGRTITI